MSKGSEIKEIKIESEYIQLQQLLKLIGAISMGSDAKMFLLSNDVLVDGEEEERRGRKIYSGMIVSINNELYKII